MPDPRLSVIVPVLNEAPAVTTLLADLRAALDPGDEIVVVDGGSTDGTPALAASGADRVLASRPGRSAQMNAGATAANGEWLWFVHADTRVPTTARQAIAAAVAAGHAWGRFDIRLSGRHPLLRVIETMMNIRSRLAGTATGDQGIFVTRDAFGRVGGFPSIPLMEDITMSSRLKRVGPPACIRRPRLVTSSRRWEQRGIVRTVLLMWRLRLAYALGTPAERLAPRYR